jgi:hypothetical protein
VTLARRQLKQIQLWGVAFDLRSSLCYKPLKTGFQMKFVLSLAVMAFGLVVSSYASAAVAHPVVPPRAQSSCNTPIGVISNGGVAIGFLSPNSSPGQPCETGSAICVNGVLNGPPVYPSCHAASQDCNGVPNGGSFSGYISSVPHCVASTVTCIDGVLSGPMPSPACVDQPN